LTKTVATEWGIAFTAVFFAIFWLSEPHAPPRRRRAAPREVNVRYTAELGLSAAMR
jgi:hypothetical protein